MAERPKTTEGSSGKSRGFLHSVEIPAGKVGLQHLGSLLKNPAGKLDDMKACMLQDPIILLALYTEANGPLYDQGREPISHPHTVLVRLGQGQIEEIVTRLKDCEEPANPELTYHLELHRGRARRYAETAMTIAQHCMPASMIEECAAAALLFPIGDMIAVTHLQEKYLEAAQAGSVPSIRYKLSKDFRFNVTKFGDTFLKHQRLPHRLHFAINTDLPVRAQDHARLRIVVQAARELVNVFDQERWDSYAPGKQLPPRSHLRLLKFGDKIYGECYEQLSRFLTNEAALEECRLQQILLRRSTPGESITPEEVAALLEAIESIK